MVHSARVTSESPDRISSLTADVDEFKSPQRLSISAAAVYSTPILEVEVAPEHHAVTEVDSTPMILSFNYLKNIIVRPLLLNSVDELGHSSIRFACQ